MGAGIAEVAACGGHYVKIFDWIPEAVPRALEKVRLSLSKSVSRGKLAPAAAEDIERRIAPVTSLYGLGDAGLVIEAIIEDFNSKRQLIQDLEDILPSIRSLPVTLLHFQLPSWPPVLFMPTE